MGHGRTLTTALVTAFLVTAGTAVTSSPARAASNYGCAWPQVCLYRTHDAWTKRTPTAAYRGMGRWQTLGARGHGSFAVHNSRNDDGALLRLASTRRTICVRPNTFTVTSHAEIVTHVLITDSPHCAR